MGPAGLPAEGGRGRASCCFICKHGLWGLSLTRRPPRERERERKHAREAEARTAQGGGLRGSFPEGRHPLETSREQSGEPGRTGEISIAPLRGADPYPTQSGVPGSGWPHRRSLRASHQALRGVLRDKKGQAWDLPSSPQSSGVNS